MIERATHDQDYWEALNPQAHITENPWPSTFAEPLWSDKTTGTLRAALRAEGYAKGPVFCEPSDIDPLIAIILNVVRAGHRPACALVYDEFYAFFQKIGVHIERVFQSDVLVVPDEFDVHYVPNHNDAAGSKPHRDNIDAANYMDADNLPGLLNVWVPLTDATPLNSCIYVLPADRDPLFKQAVGGRIVHWQPDDSSVQAIRAVPANAGSMLFWAPSLLHWGSRGSAQAHVPRISVACYFQSAGTRKFHSTAMPMQGTLPFSKRIELINKVIKT
ncbi:MAG: phytanoyl-CoA dioxygenase family protein [Pseudomonadota bacterium]